MGPHWEPSIACPAFMYFSGSHLPRYLNRPFGFCLNVQVPTHLSVSSPITEFSQHNFTCVRELIISYHMCHFDTAINLRGQQRNLSDLGPFGVGHRPSTHSLTAFVFFESGIFKSLLSPEVKAASIGPDLRVLPDSRGTERWNGDGGTQKAQSVFMHVPCCSWCDTQWYKGKPAGIKADVEKLNTNAWNVSGILII